MAISEDIARQIIKRAEQEARRGNKVAMNMLHLLDLKRAGHKAENLDIPSEGGSFVPRRTDNTSIISSPASW